MIIQYLFHDWLFYVCLAFLVEHGVVAFVVYRFAKPFMHILRVSKLGKRHDVAQPFTPSLGHSSLRDKLHGAKN